jgi:protein-S-isoprenylcysteine O-methyltransferase Ste14
MNDKFMNGKQTMDAGARFVTFAPLPALAILMAIFAHGPWNALRLIGAALVIVFLGLLTVARLQLGNSFSVTPQAKALVTHGIYSKIRHPVYVFSAIMIVGMALYLEIPWLLLLLVIDAYRQYKATTWL